MKFTAFLSAASLLVLAACQESSVTKDTVADDASVATPHVETVASHIERTATKNAYFGDTHVHTRNSFDAFVFGTRTTPDDAYRFAKGATISNGAGAEINLSGPPLDFFAVTDHGEYMGVIAAMANPDSPLSQTETAQAVFGADVTNPRAGFTRIGLTIVSGEEIEDIYNREHIDSVWAKSVETANRHYEPGRFTTFAGYEFTAMQQASDIAALNLHRNVIFKDGAPARLFSTLDSTNPEDLWDWMDGQRAKGIDVLAIPHNSNGSNGQMFSLLQTDGSPYSRELAAQRLANEPIIEITQVKGTSETHPMLSPNDEWSDFELYEFLIGSTENPHRTPGVLPVRLWPGGWTWTETRMSLGL